MAKLTPLLKLARSLLLQLALIAAISALPACSAKAKKARELTRAENYFKAGEYDNARIAYTKVLQLDPQNAVAIQRLGTIWFEDGALFHAFPFLVKTKELMPTDSASRLQLGRGYLTIGQYDLARKEATAVLAQNANDGEALLFLAESARTPDEITEVQQTIEKFPDQKATYRALAAANLAVKQGKLKEALEMVKEAVASDPNSAEAHTALGKIYIIQKDLTKAGEELKAAADLAPLRSRKRIEFAEFRAQTGARPEAKSIGEEIAKKAPDYLPAWRFLAESAIVDKKYDEAIALLENVFHRDTDNFDARVLQAQVYLAKNNPDQAVETLERLVKAFPNIPGAKYHLARAYLRTRNPAKAATVLQQAISANPEFDDAILLLAEINLETGSGQGAVKPLEELLKRRPFLPQAQLLLASGYRATGRLDDAIRIIRLLVKANPSSAEHEMILGMLLRQQGKLPEARLAFEKAAELAPDDLQPVTFLVEIDVAEKKLEAAAERAQKQVEKAPQSAAARFLQARIEMTQGQVEAAQAALLKTIELDPKYTQAYDALIASYVSTNKLDPALAETEKLLAGSPSNPQALMTAGLIHEKKGDFAAASQRYEALLKTNPDFAPALNNLAYIYAELLNQPDKAVDLARKARSVQPNDPAIADTLGWILFKRGDYEPSLALLQESADKLPNQPEVHFHFGMANYMMGDSGAAKRELQLALNSNVEGVWKEDARRHLALLQAGPEAKSASADELRAILKQTPNDVLVWLRLADVLEHDGDFKGAAGACGEALRVNPKLLPAIVKAARLYSGPLNDPAKAFEFAKKARDLGPSDPATLAVLGAVGLETGNLPWAYSLLQQSAEQQPGNPATLRTLALTAYGLGRTDEARRSMKGLLERAPTSAEAADARSFLSMTELDEAGANPASLEGEAEKILQQKPAFVPALMVRAAGQVRRGEYGPAAEIYAGLLQKYPDLTPAQTALAAVYAREQGTRDKAYELAAKARKTRPDDPELAALLGELAYHRKEYAYASQLLQESAGKKPLAPRPLFYLGMSLCETKQKDRGHDALQKALDAGLQEPFASHAKRTLAERESK